MKSNFANTILNCVGRSPCGERGLKFVAAELDSFAAGGRSPCGERGLKCKSFATACAAL